MSMSSQRNGFFITDAKKNNTDSTEGENTEDYRRFDDGEYEHIVDVTEIKESKFTRRSLGAINNETILQVISEQPQQQRKILLLNLKRQLEFLSMISSELKSTYLCGPTTARAQQNPQQPRTRREIGCLMLSGLSGAFIIPMSITLNEYLKSHSPSANDDYAEEFNSNDLTFWLPVTLLTLSSFQLMSYFGYRMYSRYYRQNGVAQSLTDDQIRTFNDIAALLGFKTTIQANESFSVARRKVNYIQNHVSEMISQLEHADKVGKKFLSFWSEKYSASMFFSDPPKIILEYLGAENILKSYESEAAIVPNSLRKISF